MKTLIVCKAKGLAMWLVLLCATLCDASVADAQSPAAKSSRTVYICTGPYAEAYHATPHCTGLANCSGDIKKVTQADALTLGRHPCKIYYKHSATTSCLTSIQSAPESRQEHLKEHLANLKQ